MQSNTSPRSFIRRKAPRQKRSQLTFDSIKIATMELIARDGFSALSTIAIAARAGIGVGSLYQYFPNREAVLLTIYEEITSQVVETIKRDLPNILDAPLEQSIHRTAKNILTLFKKNRLVLLDLPRQMPELHLDNHSISFDLLIHGTLRIFLRHRSERESAAAIEHRAFFIEQILIGSIHRYLIKPPYKLPTADFLNHVTRIIVDYIRNVLPEDTGAASF